MYDYKNKQMNMRREFDFLLSKTLSMFQYQGLPETMPKRDFERQLQTKGYAFVTEFEGDLYSFTDGLGGEPDPYGNPTQIVIANPSLDYHATLDLKEDGVLIRNDSMQNGIRNLLRKYVYMMNESEITMLVNSFNARVPTLISAGDDATRESAEEYLRQVVNGELGVIGENRIFEGINAQTTGHGGSMYTQLIEYHQYLKASLYNELGLEMNHNMKRERLTEDEVNMVDTIYPFVDNMMMNRLEGIEAVNKMYGTEIKIAYDSVWGKHEGFDEEQFYDEISGYLGIEQEQQQAQEESSVLELEAVLAELEALESEDETDDDITDTDGIDSGDSEESDTDDDRGESESAESYGDNGPSGSDRSDDRGSDGDDRHDASDAGEHAGDGTDDESEPDTGSTSGDNESSDREPNESDGSESDGGSSGDDTVREHGSRGSADEHGSESEGSGHDRSGDEQETDDDTSESGERTVEVTVISKTDTSTDTETEGTIDEPDVVEVNVEVTTDVEEVEETEEESETEEDPDETQPDEEGTQEDTEDADEDEVEEEEEENEG